jgi:hypothetical protein
MIGRRFGKWISSNNWRHCYEPISKFAWCDGGVGVNGTVAETNAPATAAGLSVTGASPGGAPALSYNARYLLKLYQSGLNEDTLLSYINTSPDTYSLNAQDVAYFQTAGIPANLTQAMTERDAELQAYSAAKDLAQAASDAGVENAILLDPDTVAINPGAPPPEVTVIGNGSSYDVPPGYGADSGGYAYNEMPTTGVVIIGGGGPVWGGFEGIWGHHGGFRTEGGFRHGGFGGGFHHGGAGGGFHGGGSGGHGGGHR